MDILQRLGNAGVVPVVVIEDAKDAVPTAKAMLSGGIDVMEITFRTAAAADSIKAVADSCPDMLVGAGTVITLDQCKQAVACGAKFIVSPGFDEEVVRWCVDNGVAVTPGCVTPMEITAAMKLGLKVVKFFPANVYGGLTALKALSAPFGGVKFIPTGGVNDKNLGEFISAPRLDDLQCAYGCFQGFLAASDSASAPVFALLDNEEVGSLTKQGADGTFLSDLIDRLCAALGRDRATTVANSFMVSADNAHAVHPNHPEYADATHRPVMNGGVVIKHGVRYATDGAAQAVFTALCQKAGVPVQHFSNRSDLAGGSTLGNISNAHVSLNTVDIGLAQLAMHSCFETAGAEDTDHLIRAMTAFYSASFREDNGTFTLA